MNTQTVERIEINVSMLQSHGFVKVAYPQLLRESVQRALTSWQRFCELPFDKKNLLSGGDRINDFGYMHRNDAGSRADRKEQFHALRANFPLLLLKAKQINDKRTTEFISAIDEMIEHMEEIVRAFAAAVERYFHLPGFEHDVMSSKDQWTFRFINYPPGHRSYLANSHGDRGGATFHLCETEEGGEYYCPQTRRWSRWPVSETETIIFPGAVLHHRSRGKLKTLWHRVVPNERSVVNGRFSMVAFIDFKWTHRFDDSRFRMQEFEPDYIYDLLFEELDTLFVPC